MKKFLIAAAGLVALATPALAADMAPAPYTKAPAVIPVPVYDWSGFYIGGSLGGESDQYGWAFNPPIPAAPNQAYNMNKSSGAWGVHGGYQRQFGSFVLGGEIGFIGNFGSNTAFNPTFGNNAALDSEARITNGIFEVGGRAGFAAQNWLFYGTAGYANTTINTQAVAVPVPAPAVFVSRNTYNGGYAGVGVDYGITANWIVGVDYQHVFFGNQLNCASPGQVCLGAAGGFVDRNVKLDTDVIRARLSYKFGGPVVARY